MDLFVARDGQVRCLYDEAIPLAALGIPLICRASNVEPVANGQWLADLSPVSGPVLGPFPLRSDALTAERDWLNEHWLARIPT